ncbi:MAG TPA: YggS family pyridoxal phosphate-dependent enzyme [Bacteroidales bacterium]|nr:MAG: hypothetical protein BWX63_02294 [Bacteroidetes bacterium ADurb.Bin041]HNV49345.1 YggS family pyridoxal phosphate-dependent enzyme [Bacteroidales bacterium]HNY58696.1 YggS family pyridoxal phosphate-dependent enzyme [Bacteroidales bacterium]HOG65926.1 YggS family pyridoxal phosphate-dependent enzyme [Bacteroidales bacterium]HPA11643.1 YggS family pyridoxal phosphate-dependent enzyme [Bacteroidales bacterium]
MGINQNIKKIKNELPANVKLIAVSKTKGIDEIMEAYNAGQRHFGENKVQEMIAKQPHLPSDIHWHFIGHLQTNKVKFIAPFVNMIESVDRLKVLKEINKHAAALNRVIPCLLQFHIAEEESKFGLTLSESYEILDNNYFDKLKNVSICGVMGMATLTDDKTQISKEFKNLKIIFDTLKQKYFQHIDSFKEISMGMSGDYLIAIEQGSTIIRLGSVIFGQRD